MHYISDCITLETVVCEIDISSDIIITLIVPK